MSYVSSSESNAWGLALELPQLWSSRERVSKGRMSEEEDVEGGVCRRRRRVS